MRLLKFLPICFVVAVTHAWAEDSTSDQCLKLYQGSFLRLSTSSQINIAVETIARDSCSGSSFNLEGSFDSKTQALINGVPGVNSLLGNLGISSTKQLCEAYKSGRFSLSADDRSLSEPVVEAMAQANQCMDIANRRDVVLRHVVMDPGKVTFGGEFKKAGRPLRFTVQTTGGFSCTSARPGSSRIDKVGSSETVRSLDFGIECTRNGVVKDGNIDFTDGVITVNLGDALYTVRVRADSLYGATSRRTADERIADGRTALAKSNAALAALQDNYAKRTYTAENYFFGERDFGPPITTRFPCETWRLSESAKLAAVKDRLCSNGTIKSGPTGLFDRGGEKCGYHYYQLVCERGG